MRGTGWLWHPTAVGVREDARTLLQRGFIRLPPARRLALLHRLGRYAPWEDQFDFTPPSLGRGERTGPPDFVGIGVQKAGTTWWYRLLSSHPGIFTRPDLHKERHFFDRFGTVAFRASDVAAYHGWFPRPVGMATGEWTPDYFTLPWVPALLREAAPETRLLVLLRDPVDRMLSGLAHQNRVGMASDGATIADAVQRGFYARALGRWLEHFESNQLLVLQYERCALEPETQLAATLDFLGLPRLTGGPAASSWSGGSGRLPGADDELRRRLVELYAPDVTALAGQRPEVELALWPNFAHLAR